MPHALDVWLPLPVPALLYLAPHGAPTPVAGGRVAVPWQGGVRAGLVAEVLEVGAARALELKEAIAVLDEAPWVLEPARRMLAAQAARAAASPGVALATMLPVGLSEPLLHEARRVEGVDADALGDHGGALVSDGWVDIDAAAVPREAIALWREHGLIRERVQTRPERRRALRPVHVADAGLQGGRQASQRAALEHLLAAGEVAGAAELARAADVPDSAARALVRKGYAAYVEVDAPPPPPPWAVSERAAAAPLPPFPTAERRVLVSGGTFESRLAWLLAAVAADVTAGGQVLVLAPEGAAVSALSQRLASVAPTLVLGGDLAPRAREAAWREAALGEPLALVGTYQALTAPLPRLARVLVWDAASPSHKLVAGTRSVARRDAEVLAQAANAAVALFDVLATPELRAMRPTRTLHEPVPQIRLATSDLRSSPTWPLGGDLIRTLRQVEERARQALVLVPRRGFSAGLACRDCGSSVMCPNCDLPLRWYERHRRLRCHQCGHERSAPPTCRECGGAVFEPLPGAGTEWVAREVSRVVPRLTVTVVDADHRPDLQELYRGEPGVIVATTAALRLSRLPALSLLALTLGDALYTREDFRADEQALRTMLALSDLAGERRPLVLVQTFQPQHRLWRVLAADDHDCAVQAYAAALEARRRAFGYPPARQWARVQVTHRDQEVARRAALGIKATLVAAGVDADALVGPAPTGVARVRGRYAQQLFVRADDDVALASALAHLDHRPAAGAQLRVDVDPHDVVAWLE